jgi:hypothetical protein
MSRTPQRDRSHELLTKADVVRQYRYPLGQLNDDIKQGLLPCFYIAMTRYYIPRQAIEARITELADKRTKLRGGWGYQ